MKRLLTCRILRPVCNVKEFKSHSQRRRQLRLLGSATELSIMQLSLRPSAFKRLALLLPSFFLSFASAAQTVPVDVTIDGSKTHRLRHRVRQGEDRPVRLPAYLRPTPRRCRGGHRRARRTT